MGKLLPKISTTVRNALALPVLRIGFRLESAVAPSAAIRRAARIFCTPFASSRQRALRAPSDGAPAKELFAFAMGPVGLEMKLASPA